MKALRLTGIFALLLVLFPAIALAQNTVSGAVNGDMTEGRQERIEKAKTSYPQQLSDDQKQLLASRCKTAQDRLSSIARRLDTRSPSILQAYTLVDRQLAAIQKRLSAHEIDTSIIDLFLITYRRQANDLSAAMSDYYIALSDAASVDCGADPSAFKSLLENARVKCKAFTDAITQVSNTVNTEMKSSFSAIRERLGEAEE